MGKSTINYYKLVIFQPAMFDDTGETQPIVAGKFPEK